MNIELQKYLGWLQPMNAAEDQVGGGSAGGEEEVEEGEGGSEGAAPAAKPKASILESDADASDRLAPTDWPDDWRQKLAGEDEASLKRMARFGSPVDIWKSYRALETARSKGDLVSKLPKDADEKAVAAWREANGIPAEPAGYYENLGDLVIGEDDKARADAFFERAHAHNLSPEAARDLVKWTYESAAAAAEAQEAADLEATRAGTDELIDEWGSGFRSNLNHAKNLLALADDDVREMLEQARGPDGLPVMAKPGMVKFLYALAQQLNPAGSMVPEAGMDQLATIEQQISEIPVGSAKYWRDEKMQERLRQLYDARDRLKARG